MRCTGAPLAPKICFFGEEIRFPLHSIFQYRVNKSELGHYTSRAPIVKPFLEEQVMRDVSPGQFDYGKVS